MIGNDYRAYVENDYNSLYHFGVRGQKWGVRRFQNSDGSLTPEGKMRYNKNDSSVTKRVKNDWNNLDDKQFFNKYKTSKKTYAKRVRKYGDPYLYRKKRMNTPGTIDNFIHKQAQKNAKMWSKTNKKENAKKVAAGVAGLLGADLLTHRISNTHRYRKAMRSVGKDPGFIGAQKAYDKVQLNAAINAAKKIKTSTIKNKGKIGIALAGAAGAGAIGYAAYKHTKNLYQPISNKEARRISSSYKKRKNRR